MQHAIGHLRHADPVLAVIIDRVGPYRIQYRDPDFDTLVRSIVYQQLSGKVAAVILARLIAAAGGTLTPERVLRLRPARMRTLGLSTAKTAYIRDLARHTRDGNLDFNALRGLPDQEVIDRLTQVKGIGVWTAQMFLMFALQRPDVLPTADLGIRNAIQKAYGLAEAPKPKDIEKIAEAWRPWCTVACWYLWRSLEGLAAL